MTGWCVRPPIRFHRRHRWNRFANRKRTKRNRSPGISGSGMRRICQRYGRNWNGTPPGKTHGKTAMRKTGSWKETRPFAVRFLRWAIRSCRNCILTSRRFITVCIGNFWNPNHRRSRIWKNHWIRLPFLFPWMVGGKRIPMHRRPKKRWRRSPGPSRRGPLKRRYRKLPENRFHFRTELRKPAVPRRGFAGMQTRSAL